jgi:ribose/xylose/arabinose/galactoside ABC-type transport system permease subunit
MQTLYNMIVLWKISAQLELAIVGVVILLGVMADEGLKRFTRQ